MRFLVVGLLILVSCAREPSVPSPAPATAAEPSPAPSTAPAPVPAVATAQREITIEKVEAVNPVVVTGRARTFENNVVVRVRNERGNLMKETFTTADGEMGQHNPYRAEVWLTADPGTRITVEALEYSAKDGSERSLVRAQQSFDTELVEIELQLPNADCTGLATEKRRVPKSIAMARLVVESVMTHPVFPKGSAVQSVNLRDGVLTVDFNERLQNVGGSCAVQMIRASVTETLKRLPSVKSVVITAGGSEKLALQP